MEQGNFQPASIIKNLKVAHAAIVIGCVIFPFIAYYLSSIETGLLSHDKVVALTFFYLSLFLVALIPLAYYLFKKNIEKIATGISLPEKLFLYRKYYIIKIVMIEAVCFLNIFFFLLTNIKFILYIAVMAIIVLAVNYPNKTTIAGELKLNKEEVDQL